MKRILILLIVIYPTIAFAYELEDLYEIEDLIGAMSWVESRDNPNVYNKEENAVGLLQIRPIMIREVNRLLEIEGSSTRYTHEHAWDKNCSIEIINNWIRLNKYYSFEKIARNWNGGYKGIYKTSTIVYWRKVRKALYRREE